MHRLSCCLLGVGLLLAGGCSSGEVEPTPREVEKELARNLKERPEHVLLDELHETDPGKYEGRAESGADVLYKVEAKLIPGRRLEYSAHGSSLAGEPVILRGTLPLPVPTIWERHRRLTQWLRAGGCVVQGLFVVWVVLGRYGYRRQYSPRVETVLALVAAVNLGFALLWGYQFYTNLGAG
jgi:hypothetical protein